MTDAQLAKKALKNPDDFALLMERYEAKLLRYVQRFSGISTELAEEALQEAFLKMYRNLNDYDASFPFSSWAYRITRNETINFIKKERKSDTIPLETDEEETKNLIDVLQSEVDLPKEFYQKDLSKKVQAIISHLSTSYREVLILRYLEDLDYKEIGDILKKPTGTISTLISRAKEQFKTLAMKNHLNTL